ncbi:MAG: hypothetical protein AAGU14_10655 [Eubacteriaceae bacterium]
MQKINKGKYFNSLTIGVAAVWFSSHCGAGFASGTQEVAYFVRHGWLAPFFPLWAMIIVGTMMYITLEIGRLNQAFSYSQVVAKAYAPIQVVLGTTYDIVTTITMLLAPAACLAAGAVLFNQYFGIPNFFGTLIMLILTVLVCIFGAKAVRMFGTALTILMIICVAAITITGIAANWDVIAAQIAEKKIYTSYGQALWYGTLYGLFQANIWTAGCASAVGMRYRNEPKGAALTGVILNTLMLSFVVLMLMGGMPAVATDPQAKLLPTLYVVNQLGVPAFKVIYPILLFMALITTAVGFVFAVQTRLGLLFFKKMENQKLKNAIISTGWLVIIWLVAQMGLITIVQKGYAFIGYIMIFLLIIPMLTLGLMNIKKYRKLEDAGQLPPGMDNRISA